jgi:hypothetical protein
VAVLEATTAYKLNGSLPVVGTNTGVFAAIGNPVVVVTPLGPIKAAALEETSTPCGKTNMSAHQTSRPE